jgi:hypothetical protein
MDTMRFLQNRSAVFRRLSLQTKFTLVIFNTQLQYDRHRHESNVQMPLEAKIAKGSMPEPVLSILAVLSILVRTGAGFISPEVRRWGRSALHSITLPIE